MYTQQWAMAVTAKDERCTSAMLVPTVAHAAHPSSLRQAAAASVVSFVAVAVMPPGHGAIQSSVVRSMMRLPSCFECRVSCLIAVRGPVMRLPSCVMYHRRLWSIERRPSSVGYRLSSIIRRASSVVIERCPLSVARCPFPIVHQASSGWQMGGRGVSSCCNSLAQPVSYRRCRLCRPFATWPFGAEELVATWLDVVAGFSCSFALCWATAASSLQSCVLHGTAAASFSCPLRGSLGNRRCIVPPL